MPHSFQRRANRVAIAVGVLMSLVSFCSAQDKSAASGDAQITRVVGTIKAIQGESITVAPDIGSEKTATLAGSTKILRVPPGEKDLKNAVPLTAQDLQPGDRVLVRGQGSADGHSVAALAVIVMKQGDLSAKQQRDRDDWQKRGVGGLVKSVDPASGTITITSGGFGAVHSVAVQTAKTTVLRRYAPNSVKFDDAKPAPLEQIKTGDQLRARGTRSTDGNTLAAEEIVTGEFRNIAGTILAIDPAAGTMTVQDTIRKATVVVKVTTDSQMRKVPQEFAQRIAARLKGTGDGVGEAGAGAPGSSPAGTHPSGTGVPMSRGSNGAPGGNGAPDLQRMLSRLPNSTLVDLQKGEAVMIVSTDGAESESVTAITLLAGVEPILTAAPSKTASTILSPWSLSASASEGEGQQGQQ